MPKCLRHEFEGGFPYPDGLGHFFREEFAKIKWAFAWFWAGLNPCQDGLGHLCSENCSSIRYFLLLTRDLRLARIVCGTYIPSKQVKILKIGQDFEYCSKFLKVVKFLKIGQ